MGARHIPPTQLKGLQNNAKQRGATRTSTTERELYLVVAKRLRKEESRGCQTGGPPLVRNSNAEVPRTVLCCVGPRVDETAQRPASPPPSSILSPQLHSSPRPQSFAAARSQTAPAEPASQPFAAALSQAEPDLSTWRGCHPSSSRAHAPTLRGRSKSKVSENVQEASQKLSGGRRRVPTCPLACLGGERVRRRRRRRRRRTGQSDPRKRAM